MAREVAIDANVIGARRTVLLHSQGAMELSERLRAADAARLPGFIVEEALSVLSGRARGRKATPPDLPRPLPSHREWALPSYSEIKRAPACGGAVRFGGNGS